MTATLVSACCWLCNPTRPCCTTRPARRRRRGIAGAGHLGGEVVPRRREPQQPVQAGPDHVGADQHQQPGAQVRQRLRRGRCRPDGRQSGWSSAPLATPSLLPAVAGLGPQPVHYGQHPQPPSLLTDRVVQRERRRQHPIEHRGPARLGRRPRRGDRSGRERGDQLRPGRVRRPGHRGRGIGGSRRQHLRVGGGHDPASPNRICRLSARYPAAGGAAGSRSRWRAWKASTPAITSSVTGFK